MESDFFVNVYHFQALNMTIEGSSKSGNGFDIEQLARNGRYINCFLNCLKSMN